jgi:hypothetical protein
MSTVEKAVLTSVPTLPLPSVHEVQPQPDRVLHGKPWWFWWLAEQLTDWLCGVVMARTPRPSHAKPHIAWKERSVEP